MHGRGAGRSNGDLVTRWVRVGVRVGVRVRVGGALIEVASGRLLPHLGLGLGLGSCHSLRKILFVSWAGKGRQGSAGVIDWCWSRSDRSDSTEGNVS